MVTGKEVSSKCYDAFREFLWGVGGVYYDDESDALDFDVEALIETLQENGWTYTG